MKKIATPKCEKCGKSAYPQESITIPYNTGETKVWHNACFKCATCKKALNASSFFLDKNVPYCKFHRPKPAATVISDSCEVRYVLNAPKKIAEGLETAQKGTGSPRSYFPLFLDESTEEFTELIERGKKDGQKIFFCSPKRVIRLLFSPR